MDSEKFTINIRNTTFTVRSFILCSIAILLIGIWVPILALLWLLCVGTYVLYNRYKFTTIESLGLSILGVVCANIALYSISTLVRASIDVWFAIPLLSFIGLVVLGFNVRKNDIRLIKINQFTVSKSDVFALLLLMGTFAFLLIPIIHAGATQISQFMSYGEDNASHYALTRYIYQSGGFAYQQNPNNIGVT